MRLHDAAISEHLLEFDHDDTIATPEACVVGVRRVALVCPTAASILAVMESLRAGFTAESPREAPAPAPHGSRPRRPPQIRELEA